MHNLKRGILVVLATLLFGTVAIAQTRTPTSAVPYLSIAPDARSSGMGDVGAATTPDVNSGYWNPAKFAFIETQTGVGYSYTPWLRNIVGDMSLSYATGYYKINKNSTLSANLNYFDMGLIQFTSATGVEEGVVNSNELGAGVSYSSKLNEKISVGVGLRYISSNLTGSQYINNVVTKPGRAVAGDISVYRAPVNNGKQLRFSHGLVISNLGGKMNYGGASGQYFLPTNFRIGTTAHLKKSAHNRFAFSLDLNKLMVPTPPERDANGVIVKGKDENEGSVLGRTFGSFADAPDGFGEELKEFSVSLGAEYVYREQISFRAGYFHENADKGNRKFLSAGLGAKFQDKYNFDFSYLFQPSQDDSPSPLSNTLRLSASIFFNKAKKNTEID
jgi:long-subunit fatty acid transport protein